MLMVSFWPLLSTQALVGRGPLATGTPEAPVQRADLPTLPDATGMCFSILLYILEVM